MKSIVLYFSQTGNTRKIAQAIHTGLRESMDQCDVVRLKDVCPDDLNQYDLIGLGSPVWHRREPSHVMNFIEYSMNGLEEKHGFAFCTHGLYPGRFLARVVPFMTQRGLIMIGWNNWYSGVFLPEKPKPYFTDGHPDEIDLEEAKQFGAEMAERSRRIYAGEEGLIPALPKGRDYDEIYPGPDRKRRAAVEPGDLKQWARLSLRSFNYTINEKKCGYPGCTVCMDNCPTNSIDPSQSPPIFKETCDRCWYCEQICPRGAIEIDWEPIADFFNKNVIHGFAKVSEEAEARGRFRRLVPLKDVGWNTYWHTIKKPPRLKPE